MKKNKNSDISYWMTIRVAE